jgi:ethanolamine utilization cobalamin adenosyltransferase
VVITESELRQMWRDGRQPLPAFPPGTRFTPAARDFLKDHSLDVRFANPAPPTEDAPQPASVPPTWDKPGAFPVVLTGPASVCITCGQPLPHKPDHPTQLDAGRVGPTTAPRIKLRGRLDSLHALTLLTAAEARRCNLPALAAHLETLAAYCRELQSAEYHARAAAPLALAGYSEAELHDIACHPDRHLDQPHLDPGPRDHAILHWLNLLRAHAREVEFEALEACPPGPAGGAVPGRGVQLNAPTGDAPFGDPGPSLARGLNRLSSAVYVLALLFQTGRLAWNPAPSASA